MKKRSSTGKTRIVYSTDPDFKFNRDEEESQPIPPPSEQKARIRREKKGRKGKTVTVIEGILGEQETIRKSLQKLCGSGGTIKEGCIEIQGDHRKAVLEYLLQRGYKAKISGG